MAISEGGRQGQNPLRIRLLILGGLCQGWVTVGDPGNSKATISQGANPLQTVGVSTEELMSLGVFLS